jgi:2-oxoglutarate ferredoxin oxidoreductase subunit gamma
MQEEFVFSGFGGQGVMFAGQLLAYTAMDEGLEVTWIPSYGPEMRGGTAHCFVVISDRIIGSPMVARPMNGVIFNKPSFDKYEAIIAPNGRLVVNTSLVPQTSNRTDIEFINIPATDIAYELGDQRLTNMVLLGALLRDHRILPIEALKRALEAHIPAHRRNLLEKNFRAVERGAELIKV